MITKLNGHKLLTHSDIYNLISNNSEAKRKIIATLWVPNASLVGAEAACSRLNISLEVANSIFKGTAFVDFLTKLNFGGTQIKYEDPHGWDIMICQIPCDYYIEYKSNVSEWKKGIHQFLAQINKRGMGNRYEGGHHERCSQENRFKILMTFDESFEQYRKVLSDNKIRLVILDQDLTSLNNLKNDENDDKNKAQA